MANFSLEGWRKKKYKTRDGRIARVICIDRVTKHHLAGPVIALVLGHGGQFEQVVQYDIDGHQINYAKEFDLIDEA